MFNFSFASITMAILTSNFLLIILHFVLKHEKTMIHMGYRLLTIFICLSILRVLIPLEFPTFSQNMYYPELLSKLVSGFQHPRFNVGKWQISFWNLFEMIWGVGIVIGLFSQIKARNAFHKLIVLYGTDVSLQDRYRNILDNLCLEKKRHCNFTIMKLPYIQTPMIYGIRKPCILLPDSLDLQDRELYYVLSHETAHFFQHDLMMKYLIQLLCLFYWWNPISHFLQLQTNTLFEMRVDRNLVSTDVKRKCEYIECLLKIAKLQAEKNAVDISTDKTAIAFCSSSSSIFKQRVLLLTTNDKNSSRNIAALAFVLVILAMYVLSFLVIFESDYIPNNIRNGTFDVNKESSFLIKISPNTYKLYIDNSYVGTLDSVDGLPQNIKIYNKTKETNYYEKH